MRITDPVQLAAHLSLSVEQGAAIAAYISDQVRSRTGLGHPDQLTDEAYDSIAAELRQAHATCPRHEIDALRYICVTTEERILQHLPRQA